MTDVKANFTPAADHLLVRLHLALKTPGSNLNALNLEIFQTAKKQQNKTDLPFGQPYYDSIIATRPAAMNDLLTIMMRTPAGDLAVETRAGFFLSVLTDHQSPSPRLGADLIDQATNFLLALGKNHHAGGLHEDAVKTLQPLLSLPNGHPALMEALEITDMYDHELAEKYDLNHDISFLEGRKDCLLFLLTAIPDNVPLAESPQIQENLFDEPSLNPEKSFQDWRVIDRLEDVARLEREDQDSFELNEGIYQTLIKSPRFPLALYVQCLPHLYEAAQQLENMAGDTFCDKDRERVFYHDACRCYEAILACPVANNPLREQAKTGIANIQEILTPLHPEPQTLQARPA